MMQGSKISRREFNKAAAMGAVGLALSSGVRSVLGANERLGIGLIGAGGMGQANLREFLRTGRVECVAIADVHEPNLGSASGMTGGRAKCYKDFRRLLEHKDIQAVIIATPDHWHAIPMILACEAGKDVYVEEPLSHTLVEGRKMVEAAAKYNRVVQVGTQHRSGEHFQKAVELVRGGKIGEITYVETWIHGNQSPEGIENPLDSDLPRWLDWDFWLGPAPYRAYDRDRRLSAFRWFWDYSGGTLTDQGTRLVDIVHWAMDVNAPRTIQASGGKYVMHDNRETPDTLDVLYEYPASPVSGKSFLMRLSIREANGRGRDGHNYGIHFYGTDGTLSVDRSGYTLWPEGTRVGPEPVSNRDTVHGEGSAQQYPHVLNFVECVQSRDRPRSDVETTHRSTSAPQLANIAFKLDRKLTWDAKLEAFPGDAEANKLLTKEYRSPWKLA